MNVTDFLSVILWTLPWGVPLLLAVLLAPRGLRSFVGLLAPVAALPAFLVAVFVRPGTVVEVPLLLGTRFGLTGTTQLFLLFSAGLWLFAGFYARAYLADDPASGRFFRILPGDYEWEPRAGCGAGRGRLLPVLSSS